MMVTDGLGVNWRRCALSAETRVAWPYPWPLQ